MKLISSIFVVGMLFVVGCGSQGQKEQPAQADQGRNEPDPKERVTVKEPTDKDAQESKAKTEELAEEVARAKAHEAELEARIKELEAQLAARDKVQDGGKAARDKTENGGKAAPDKGEEKLTICKMNEEVTVGSFSYKVTNATWRPFPVGVLPRQPRASYLIVKLTVQNKDKTAREIPGCVLIDDAEAVYEAAKAITDGPVKLNPNVSATAFFVFDVMPKDGKYRLVVSNGDTSSPKVKTIRIESNIEHWELNDQMNLIRR